MVANMILLFLFIVFVLYLYSRRAHKTREHVFTVAVECVLP